MSKPSSCRWLLGLLLILPAAGRAATPAPVPLVPTLAREWPQIAADESATVTFTLENAGDEPLYVLDRELPFAGFKADLFEVRRDGDSVEYLGPLHRFGPPRSVDYRRLEPGEQLSASLDLENVYDFSRPGTYTVRFRGRTTAFRKDSEAGFVPLARVRRGAPLDLRVEREERAIAPAVAPQLELATGRSVVPVTFGCSPTRMQQIFQAVPAADQMATNALTALSFFGGPPNDYVKWFGPWNLDRHLGVFWDFANIQATLDDRGLWFYCDCTDATTFAWTQKGTQGVIHLCPLFWSAPMTGFNSKADTLVHEVSHWPTWGGDTDDYAYGMAAAQQLAITFYPWALDNADNFAYFAADQP